LAAESPIPGEEFRRIRAEGCESRGESLLEECSIVSSRDVEVSRGGFVRDAASSGLDREQPFDDTWLDYRCFAIVWRLSGQTRQERCKAHQKIPHRRWNTFVSGTDARRRRSRAAASFGRYAVTRRVQKTSRFVLQTKGLGLFYLVIAARNTDEFDPKCVIGAPDSAATSDVIRSDLKQKFVRNSGGAHTSDFRATI
jgi:hypothetical protein